MKAVRFDDRGNERPQGRVFVLPLRPMRQRMSKWCLPRKSGCHPDGERSGKIRTVPVVLRESDKLRALRPRGGVEEKDTGGLLQDGEASRANLRIRSIIFSGVRSMMGTSALPASTFATTTPSARKSQSQILQIVHFFDILDPRRQSQGGKVCAQMSAGGLGACGAVAAVVQDHQQVIFGRMMGDGGQRPQVHETEPSPSRTITFLPGRASARPRPMEDARPMEPSM